MAGVVSQTTLSGGVAVAPYSAFSGFNSITAGYTVTDTDGYGTIIAPTAPSTITFASRSSNTITVSAAHGAVTGTPIQFNGAGTIPTGLSANVVYYMIVTSTTAFKFAETIANARAGTAVTLSGDGSSTRTWTIGIGIILPTAADNVGRSITIMKDYSSLTQMITIIGESASETIDGIDGSHLAASGDAVTLISTGTKWKNRNGFFQSYYLNYSTAIASDVASGILFVVRNGSLISVDGTIVTDASASGTSSQALGTGDVPSWARPASTSMFQIHLASTSEENLVRTTVTTSGTFSMLPIDIDSAGDMANGTLATAATYRSCICYNAM